MKGRFFMKKLTYYDFDILYYNLRILMKNCSDSVLQKMYQLPEVDLLELSTMDEEVLYSFSDYDFENWIKQNEKLM